MSVKIVFLGTGSGKPTDHRGVSGVALIRDGAVLLFDCGEGTQVKIPHSSVRPGSIDAIFLSHFHGDHVNGLPGLLGSLTLNQREDPLDVVGPMGLKKWFRTLQNLHIMWPGFPIRYKEVEKVGVVLERPTYRVEAGTLRHRITSWGYAYIEDPRPGRFDIEKARELGIPHGPLYGVLQRGGAVTLDDGRVIEPSEVLGEARPGLKIVYASDTAPCEGVVELAQDADVLIHESTYPGGDEKLAHSRGHSTSADAARCAKAAGVKKLILTHFSQKYARTDVFVEHARQIFPNTIAAYDLMEYEVERQDA